MIEDEVLHLVDGATFDESTDIRVRSPRSPRSRRDDDVAARLDTRVPGPDDSDRTPPFLPGVRIGERALVAAGAVAIRDVPAVLDRRRCAGGRVGHVDDQDPSLHPIPR